MTLTYSNDLDASAVVLGGSSNDTEVTSTAGSNDKLQAYPSTTQFTPGDQQSFAEEHNKLRQDYLTPPNQPYSLTSTPEMYKQNKQDSEDLQKALAFDIDEFVSKQTAAGVSEKDALVEAKVQMMMRLGCIKAYSIGQISKDEVFAMLNGTASSDTVAKVQQQVQIVSNPEVSPSLDLKQYTSSGIGLIAAKSANGDPALFKEMLKDFYNTTYKSSLDGIEDGAKYFQDGSPYGGMLGNWFGFVASIQTMGSDTILLNPSSVTTDQQSVSSGNIATDLINQAAALSEATGAIADAKKTLRTKYGISDIASADGWNKLAGGRPIAYSEELYSALFKDSASGGKAIPKDKDEIKSLLAGNTLSPNIKPMVEAYAKLQSDPAQAQTLAKLNDALSLAYTINHLTKEVNEGRPNFEQRYKIFKEQYPNKTDLQALDTVESSNNAIKQLSAQLIRDMNPANAAPDVVPSSEHASIKAFAKDLGLKVFDKDISALTEVEKAELTKKTEVLIRAAEYVRLKNNPGTISPQQLEELKKAVGVDPAILDKVAAKYKSDKGILHLGDLCSPGVFAQEAGAALQKK